MLLAGDLAFRRDGLVARRFWPRCHVRRCPLPILHRKRGREGERGRVLLITFPRLRGRVGWGLWRLEYRRLSGPPRLDRRRRAAERSSPEINSRRLERRVLAVNQPGLRGFGFEICEVRIIRRLLGAHRLSAVRRWLFACARRRRWRGNGLRP